jgi:hypothetical protein
MPSATAFFTPPTASPSRDLPAERQRPRRPDQTRPLSASGRTAYRRPPASGGQPTPEIQNVASLRPGSRPRG